MRLSDGRDVRRYQDHVRRRHVAELGAGLDQARGAEERGSSDLGESWVPQQLPSTQSSEVTAVSVPQGVPVPLESVPSSPRKTSETLRRSQRQKKAPNRLNL